MSEIKLLKQPFNICEIKYAPTFLAPYSFVVSMPNRLTLFCPEDSMPKTPANIIDTCSCFVIEEDSSPKVMSATNDVVDILSNASMSTNVMLVQNTAYIFVNTDSAMDAVMLLTRMGYDIRYSNFY